MAETTTNRVAVDVVDRSPPSCLCAFVVEIEWAGRSRLRYRLMQPGPSIAQQFAIYRGNASTTPPSMGSVAPVVGVALLAKKTTALPTCRPWTLVLSRLRWR